jgi:hypothetical protein
MKSTALLMHQPILPSCLYRFLICCVCWTHCTARKLETARLLPIHLSLAHLSISNLKGWQKIRRQAWSWRGSCGPKLRFSFLNISPIQIFCQFLFFSPLGLHSWIELFSFFWKPVRSSFDDSLKTGLTIRDARFSNFELMSHPKLSKIN